MLQGKMTVELDIGAIEVYKVDENGHELSPMLHYGKSFVLKTVSVNNLLSGIGKW